MCRYTSSSDSDRITRCDRWINIASRLSGSAPRREWNIWAIGNVRSVLSMRDEGPSDVARGLRGKLVSPREAWHTARSRISRQNAACRRCETPYLRGIQISRRDATRRDGDVNLSRFFIRQEILIRQILRLRARCVITSPLPFPHDLHTNKSRLT